MADCISSRNKSTLVLKRTSWFAIRHCDSHETCQESKGSGLQQLVKRKNGCPCVVYQTTHYEVSRKVGFGGQARCHQMGFWWPWPMESKWLLHLLSLLQRDLLAPRVVNQTAPESQLRGPMHLEIGVTRLHAEASTNINNVGASWCINLSSSLSLSHLFCGESFCNPSMSFQPVEWISCQIHRLKVANSYWIVLLVINYVMFLQQISWACPLLPAFDTRPKCQKVCGTACSISALL